MRALVVVLSLVLALAAGARAGDGEAAPVGSRGFVLRVEADAVTAEADRQRLEGNVKVELVDPDTDAVVATVEAPRAERTGELVVVDDAVVRLDGARALGAAFGRAELADGAARLVARRAVIDPTRERLDLERPVLDVAPGPDGRIPVGVQAGRLEAQEARLERGPSGWTVELKRPRLRIDAVRR